MRSMRINKRLAIPEIITKMGLITIPVYQNTRWERGCFRPSPVIIIKFIGLGRRTSLTNQEYEKL